MKPTSGVTGGDSPHYVSQEKVVEIPESSMPLLSEIDKMSELILKKKDVLDYVDSFGAILFSWAGYQTERDKSKVEQLHRIGSVFQEVMPKNNKNISIEQFGHKEVSDYLKSVKGGRVYEALINQEIESSPRLGQVKKLIENERSKNNKLSINEFLKLKAILSKPEYETSINEMQFRQDLSNNGIYASSFEDKLDDAKEDLAEIRQELTSKRTENDALQERFGYDAENSPQFNHGTQYLNDRINYLEKNISEMENGTKQLLR